MITVESINKAIRTIRGSRQTHEHWIVWYTKVPEREAEFADTCGDTQHHKDCIAGYDQVIETLQQARKLLEGKS